MSDNPAPSQPNLLGLGSSLTENLGFRRAVRAFGLPDVSEEQRAAILREKDVVAYFQAMLGVNWRWPVLAEVRRQQVANEKRRVRAEKRKAG